MMRSMFWFVASSMKPFANTTFEHMRDAIELTVFGALRMTQGFTPALETAKGSVVNVNSMVVRHSQAKYGAQADADAQRAKLGLIGQQARVSEREQNGRPVYRVRIGPMAQRSEAEALKQQLGDTGIDAALVRIHQ